MQDYKYSLEKLYEHTDNGLDILHRYCPESVGAERKGKKFKIRNERSPSASLFKSEKCWIIKDFGSGESFSPLEFFQKETGINDFAEAVKTLCIEFNITENSYYFQPNKTYTDKGNLPDDYFFIKVKEKVENPQCFSAFVTEELCQKYNVYEVAYFERITKSGKLERTTATGQYPIFCYSDDLKKWAKTYCPTEKKRTITEADGTRRTLHFKHGYLGKKPEKYYHGLTAIEKRYSALRKLNNEDEDIKIPYIIICSGGSDGLSIASLSPDFMPVWGNSENDIIDYKTYETLKNVCENLIYLPDVDSSGINFAYKYSKMYWKLSVVFLPKYYLGEKGKDFRDYLAHFTKKANPTPKEIIASEFKKLLQVPVSCDFVTTNKEHRYRVNVRNLHYFLNSEGFFAYKPEFYSDENRNETIDFLIKKEGFVIKTPDEKEIRQFCIEYLIRKGTNSEVLQMLKKCNDFRPNELSMVPLLSECLDFSDSTQKTQRFYFQNGIFEISADNIIKINDNDHYVWEQNIIKQDFRYSEPFFEVYKDENNQNRVKILNTDCDFMNFVINTSRVFWEKEYTENKDFRKKYILNGEYLSENEQITQEQNFLAKCFAVGYLLHGYKLRGFEKYVYMVDDKLKDDLSESNGRSGKGVLAQGISKLVPYLEVNGKDKKGFNNSHWLGHYKNQKLILFNDMLNNEDTHGFEHLFTMVSDTTTINPKNVGAYTIPFEKSPKLFGTYNHALRKVNNSTMGRLLFVSFSDYYHHTSEVHKGSFSPFDDFGYRFFSDWSVNQWNMFYNFMLQCLQLYLQYQTEPLLTPMDNIDKNNLKASIGDNFFEWAEGYFDEDKCNTDLLRSELFIDYKNETGDKSTRSKGFKVKLQKFCEFKGYIFNPPDLLDKNGFIKKTAFVGQKRLSVEYFHIRTPKSANTEIQTAKPQNDDLLDDIPF